jgi:hypothetical protein
LIVFCFTAMLSLEQCRKIDPNLNDVPDQELEAALLVLYGLGKIALDKWAADCPGFQKSPLGSDDGSKVS